MAKTKPDEPVDLDAAEIELADAETELAESMELVTAIEDRVAGGDETVTSEDLASKHSLARFATLRVQALRRKVDAARTQAHRAKCQQIADRAQKLADTSGPELARLLAAAGAAQQRFIDAVTARNAQIAELHATARDLTDEHTGPGTEVRTPHARFARLGWQQANTVVIGRTYLAPTNASDWLSQAQAGRRDGKDPIEALTHIDAERPTKAGNKYYRAAGGSVIAYDRPLNEHEERNLTLLSDAELEAFNGGEA